MDFKDIQKELGPELDAVGDEIRKSLDSPIGFIGQVASYLIESGGKRFRPVVLILSSHAFGYFGGRIYSIAGTLEFIHTATLLHDDVVDCAELRRGQPSANVLWGNEATVLVGDFLLARSFLKLVEDQDIAVLNCVSKATTKMAEGEILQLLKTKEPGTTEEEYLEVVKSKTAVLISAAAEIGAIIGGAPREEQEKMRTFGMLLGIAFQITDDSLDYLTEDKTLGKTQGQDFYDGKVTLPFIYAYSKSTPEERKILEEMLVKEEKTREDFFRVYKIIEKKDGFKYCFEKARRYIADSKQLISFINNDYKKYLEVVADYTIERSF